MSRWCHHPVNSSPSPFLWRLWKAPLNETLGNLTGALKVCTDVQVVPLIFHYQKTTAPPPYFSYNKIIPHIFFSPCVVLTDASFILEAFERELALFATFPHFSASSECLSSGAALMKKCLGFALGNQNFCFLVEKQWTFQAMFHPEWHSVARVQNVSPVNIHVHLLLCQFVSDPSL